MSVAVVNGYGGMGYTGGAPKAAPRHRDVQAAEGERTYALFMHLAGLLGFFGVPLAPTLIMWAIKKDSSPYIDDHGREAMNAQISYLIYAIALAALTPITCGVAIAPLLALPVAAVVFTILASVSASRGEYHRYPITLRFIH